MSSKILLVSLAVGAIAAYTAAFAQVVPESEVRYLIEITAVGAHLDVPTYFACDEKAKQKKANDINSLFAQGNNGLAGAYAHGLARDAAACFLTNPKSIVPYVHITHHSVPELAEELGSALTMESLGSEDPTTIAHAKTFLQFAQQNGRNVDTMMHKLVGDGAQPLPPTSIAALSGTAVSIASRHKANGFGFDQQFKNKILQVSGRVSSVSGESGKANFTLLGNLDRPPETLGFPDMLGCSIEQTDALKKAATVEKGQTITVRGLYTESLMGEIVLSRCEIVR